MAKKKPAAVTAPTAPLTAYGTDLTSPGAVKAPTTGLTPLQASLQLQQNKANAANETRYNQGLGVLAGGNAAAQGSISSALANSGQIGNTRKDQIGIQYSNDVGHAQQTAVSRGLGNTTIADALTAMATRTKDLATTANNESIANQQNGLYLNQAQQNNQGAGSIASFIAARNDTGPDQAAYSDLAAKAAAANANAQKRTGTVYGGSPFPSSAKPPSLDTTGGGGGGSSGSASTNYFTKASTPPAPAPISSAMGYTGSTGIAPQQPATPGGGSISITPGVPRPISSAISGGTPAPQAPAGDDSLPPGITDPGPIGQALAAGKSSSSGAYAGNQNSGFFSEAEYNRLTPEQQRKVNAGQKL